MKKNPPAPIGASPVGQFINSLPDQAVVLSAKGYRHQKEAFIHLNYVHDGQVYSASFYGEGGSV